MDYNNIDIIFRKDSNNAKEIFLKESISNIKINIFFAICMIYNIILFGYMAFFKTVENELVKTTNIIVFVPLFVLSIALFLFNTYYLFNKNGFIRNHLNLKNNNNILEYGKNSEKNFSLYLTLLLKDKKIKNINLKENNITLENDSIIHIPFFKEKFNKVKKYLPTEEDILIIDLQHNTLKIPKKKRREKNDN